MALTVPTWALLADFNRDGTYEEVLTAKVSERTGGLSVDRGLGEDGVYRVSQLAFQITNYDGRYTPGNSAGAVYGQFDPGIPVQLKATHNAIEYVIWTGYIQRQSNLWNREAGPLENTASFTAVDLAEYLRRFDAVDVLSSQSRRTDQGVGAVLDSIGWTGARDLDVGVHTMPFHFVRAQQALSAIMDCAYAEMGGVFWITKAGAPRFEARSQRLGTKTKIRVAYGTYTGDGGTQAISGLGFAPKVVVVKANHATNGHAMIRTTTMGDAQNITNGTQDDGIQSLDTDGFTVAHVASATGRVNESGKAYYWYAFGGDGVTTSSYTGNGTSQTVSGSGFTPVMAWVIRLGTAGPFFRTTGMGADSFDFNLSAGATDEITALTSDGFSVGASANVNQSSITYHYVTFENAQNLVVGTYTGNGSTRSLPAAPMSFSPTVVGIKGDTAQEAAWRTLATPVGDASFQYATGATVSDRIESMTPANGQFQVGSDAEVNSVSAFAYYFFAFGNSGGILHTWGDGTTIVPKRIAYDTRADDFITKVQVQASVYQADQLEQEVFRFSKGKHNQPPDAFFLAAGKVYQADFNYDSAVITLTTPEANIDYLANSANDGSGTDRTADLVVSVTDKGGGATIKLGPNSVDLYVTAFRLRGVVETILGDTPIFVSAKSVAGQPSDASASITVPFADETGEKASHYSYSLLRTHRYPVEALVLAFDLHDDATAADLLSAELGDLVLYKDTALGAEFGAMINDWFYVDAIKYDLGPNQITSAEFRLTPSSAYRDLDNIAFDLFTRPDGTLGISVSGDTWLNTTGWAIASSQADPDTGADRLTWIELGAAQMVVEVSTSGGAVTGSEKLGMAYRIVDASNYYRVQLAIAAGSRLLVEKVTAGTPSTKANVVITQTGAEELRAIVQGDRHRIYFNRKLVADFTDSAHNTATKAGMYANAAAAGHVLDDWFAQGL